MTAKDRKRLPLRLLLTLLPVGLAACGDAEPPFPPLGRFDVVEATIVGIQSAISDGRTSCEAVVTAYRDRIAAYDTSRGVNAITVVNPRAIDRAREIDAALAAGEAPGQLWCAPLLIKDNFDTADLPTTGGSVAMTGHLPPDDAFMVRRLREAGAIVLAKTNMAEWAFSPRRTESSSYGVTANAYDTAHVPAGSSGGTASGVAASFGVAGMGTDTGNSVRGPSSHLALFGIRSTIGLTSRDGIIPLAFDRDIAGPMTRTVEDGARLFTVIAGHDPADPFTAEAKDRPRLDYTDYLDPAGLDDARIGVLRALADPAESDPRILALFDAALADMAAAGATLVDPFTVPDFAALTENGGFCPRFRHDMHAYLGSLGPAAPFRDVMTVLETGQHAAYVADELEFFADFPLEAPPQDWDEPCPVYLDHPDRRRFLETLTAAMDAAEVDVIVYPSWTAPPAPIDRPEEEYRGDNSQLVAPATGMPAATVPMGFVDDRLPAGLQILARRFDEPAIFRIAYAYERATRHRRPPPGFPPLED